MESRRYLISPARCPLCMTCANALLDEELQMRACSAGLTMRGDRLECESYVRRFSRLGLPTRDEAGAGMR